MESYSKAYHRSIGTVPDRVSETNAQEFWQQLHGKDFVKRSGHKVRISKKKATFEKGYLPNWTEEVFSIAQRLRTIPPVYRLKERSE